MASVTRSRPNQKRLVMAVLMIAALVLLVNARVARLDSPGAYAIKDAQIVTGTGRTIAKGTVVFRNGLITDVGENVRIPADARVIEGAGLTVYPGLIDGYTSLGLPAPAAAQPPAGGQRQGGAAPAQAAAPPPPEQQLGDPSLSAADQVRPSGAGLEDARSVGVTTALSSPRQGILAGQSALINLAGDEGSKMVVRAPVALTVQFSAGSSLGGSYPGSLMGTVAFIRQSFYDAMRYKDELDRYNRTKRGLPRPEYDKKLTALLPALSRDLPVLFVTTSDGDIRRALAIAEEFKLKPIIAGALYGYRISDIIKARNVPVILTVDFPRRPADLPEDEDESLRALRDRADAPKGPAKLAQAGVKFAFMSGSLRPQDFLTGVQKAVESGLSADAALRALTINAAEIFGAADQLGTVEVGKIANLVVTSGDLLSRDARVRHVFIDGGEVEVKRPESPAQRFGGSERVGGVAPPQQAQPGAVDPTGEWALVVRVPQGDHNIRLSLRREGDRITGRVQGPEGSYDIQNANMTGNQLRFTTSMQLRTDTLEAVVTGTIEGDSMRGVIQLPALGSFEFTGSRPR